MNRILRAAALGAPLTAAMVLGLLAPAVAVDGAPRSPSVNDVRITDARLTATLTFPASVSGTQVVADSLRARFDQREEQRVSLTPLARARRTAMVLIDTSGSMQHGGLAAARAAATEFLREVPADVAVGLVRFSDRPRLLVAPSTDRQAARTALGRLAARGDTALYDAIRLGISRIGVGGSRTLVVLSDGGDTSSRASLASVVRTVKASGVRAVAIGFQTGTSQYGVLQQIAVAGRGNASRTLDPASLRRAFGSAAQEIATQVSVSTDVPSGLTGEHVLTITGTAGGGPFVARTRVALPAVATPVDGPSSSDGTAVPRLAPTPDRSTLLTWVGAGGVFLGLLALVMLAFGGVFTPRERRRVRALDAYVGTASPARTSGARSGPDIASSLLRAGDAYARLRPSSARTAQLLERADLPLRLNEWYALRGVAVVVASCVGWLLFHGSLARSLSGLGVGLVVAALIPSLVLRVLARRRARKFEVQLPDVLTLIAGSLSTGFSLPQALDAITRDAADPAAKEFARALAETRIGAELEDALDRTAQRMDSNNLSWTILAVRIQRRVGGNLADTIRTTATTLRERESLKRQVRALSAEGRLSAYILIALPIVMGAYIWLTNRAYLALLWHRALGVGMLAASAVALVIGIVWMRRLVEVEV